MIDIWEIMCVILLLSHGGAIWAILKPTVDDDAEQ